MTDTTNTSAVTYGATLEEWQSAVAAFGHEHLLPIVAHPDAVPAKGCTVSKGMLSKAPSKYAGTNDADGHPEAWGFAGWTTATISKRDVNTWARNGNYGVCLRLNRDTADLPGVIGIDADTENEADQTTLENVLRAELGELPPRRTRKGSNRCTYLVRVPGERKKLVLLLRELPKFDATGAPEINAKTGQQKVTPEAIEFLAFGQQCVILGRHKSGARLEWDKPFTDIPTLTPEKYAEVFRAICAAFPDATTSKTKRKTDNAGAVDGDDFAAEYQAPDNLKDAIESDPLAKWMVENGVAGGDDGKKRLWIRCPNAAEHSDSDTAAEFNSSTVYLLDKRNTSARFHCSHGHCDHLNSNQHNFAELLGVPAELRPAKHGEIDPEAVAAEFEKLEADFVAAADTVVKRTKRGEMLIKGKHPDLTYEKKMAVQKAPQSAVAGAIMQAIGRVGVDTEAEQLYYYDKAAGVWQLFKELPAKRFAASFFMHFDSAFADAKLGGVVKTMHDVAEGMQPARGHGIAFKNGFFDILTREFTPHSPENYLRVANDIEWTEAADGETLETHAPNFTKWLMHASEGVQEKKDSLLALLRVAAGGLNDLQYFYELVGVGGSGKSTATKIIELLAGAQNVIGFDAKDLDNPVARSGIGDAAVILLADQAQYIGDGSGLRAITGGDAVFVNPKYGTPHSRVFDAMVVFTANDPMIFKEKNGGIDRRRVLYKFWRKVADNLKDPKLVEKIAREMPVVIRHLLEKFDGTGDVRGAVKAALEWQRTSADAHSAKVESDPLASFFEHLEFTPACDGLMMGASTTGDMGGLNAAKYLYHGYLTFAQANRDQPIKPNKLARALANHASQIGAVLDSRRVRDDGAQVARYNVRYKESILEFVRGAIPAAEFDNLSVERGNHYGGQRG